MASLAAVSSAARKAALAFQARDEAIRAAHAEGATLSAIAAAAGMSKQRAHQIVRAAPTERRLESTPKIGRCSAERARQYDTARRANVDKAGRDET